MVATDEEVLEQVSEELECDILEGECRAVEELKYMQILPLIEREERSDVRGAEGRVAPLDDLSQIRMWNLILGNIQREDVKGQLLETRVLPSLLPVLRQRWDFFGDEEAAVGGETFQDDVFEGELEGWISA